MYSSKIRFSITRGEAAVTFEIHARLSISVSNKIESAASLLCARQKQIIAPPICDIDKSDVNRTHLSDALGYMIAKEFTMHPLLDTTQPLV